MWHIQYSVRRPFETFLCVCIFLFVMSYSFARFVHVRTLLIKKHHYFGRLVLFISNSKYGMFYVNTLLPVHTPLCNSVSPFSSTYCTCHRKLVSSLYNCYLVCVCVGGLTGLHKSRKILPTEYTIVKLPSPKLKYLPILRHFSQYVLIEISYQLFKYFVYRWGISTPEFVCHNKYTS